MTHEELEAENVRLQDQLAHRDACLRNVSRKALAIAEQIRAEFAYTGPIISKGRHDEHQS